MAREDTQFRVRLPEKLREEIIEQAEKNGRSINAEIVARLENSLRWDKFDPEGMDADIVRFDQDINELKIELGDVWRTINELQALLKR